MRIFIQIVKEDLYELEVDEKTTVEYAIEMLIENYDLKLDKEKYKCCFLHRGKFLTNPEPFSHLDPDSRVILYQKEKKKDKKKKPQQDARVNDSTSFIMAILQTISRCNIERVYDDDTFYLHPAEIDEVREIISQNDGASSIISNYLIYHYAQVFRFNNIEPQLIFNVISAGHNTLFESFNADFYNNLNRYFSQERSDSNTFLYRRRHLYPLPQSQNDIPDPSNNNNNEDENPCFIPNIQYFLDVGSEAGPIPDEVAIIEGFSDKQAEDFQKLINDFQESFSREYILNSFVQNDCDLHKTVSELKSKPKSTK